MVVVVMIAFMVMSIMIVVEHCGDSSRLRLLPVKAG